MGGDLEQLFRAHWSLVLRYLLRHAPDRTVAEDLAQETFTKAARSIGGWSGDSAAGWLLSIARSVLVDHVRRSGRQVPVIYDTEAPPLADFSFDAVLVHDALSRLPVAQSRLLRLVYLEGFTMTEVAAMTGRSVGSIKTAVWRARLLFAEAYKESS